MSEKPLTKKQRVFVDEYLRSWNAAASARAAGYSERTADVIGYENLRKPQIAAEIERRLAELKMSADEALLRTADIARGDLSAWLDEDGNVDIAALKASGKGHLLKKYKVTRRTRKTKDGDELETTVTEIELYPADAAHDKLLRHLGLYNDQVRVTTWQDEVVDLLRRGEIEAADVSAAYPDLAPDFFAKAGVDVGG